MTATPKHPASILVIEDDASVAVALQRGLLAEGYAAAVASRGDDGLAQAKQQLFDVVITDLRMPGLSGLDLVGQLHGAKPKLPIILMTAYGTTESAIQATRLGAYEYLLKPFEMPQLLDLVAKAVACNQLPESLNADTAKGDPSAMIGNGRAMQELYKEIGRMAGSSVTVLIRGETGTGKELVAKAISQYGARANQPFVAVNCTAIPETLLESELFGHERGAFTGAYTRRVGRFEQAHQGTIFLDEIGDLNVSMQVKLLRVLQEKYIQRVGGNERIPVDVRVLAATHRDLEKAMAEGQFREDLFYRLGALTLRLPVLRQRLEDIPALVRHFMWRCGTEVGVQAPTIQSEAVAFLQGQVWPGNVRELENVIRQAMLLARNHPIGRVHVEQAYARSSRPVARSIGSLDGYIDELLAKAVLGEVTDLHSRVSEEMERELFSRVIRLTQGNQAKAARWLGVTRTTVREKLIHFGLQAGHSDSAES